MKRASTRCESLRSRVVLQIGSLAVVLLLVSPAAMAGIVLNFFPATSYNTNTTQMDAALGITGYQIENFETTGNFMPGLSITLSGWVSSQTWTALPALFVSGSCPYTGNQAWDGSSTATNATGNIANDCYSPTNIAKLLTINYGPGTKSLGIGLANFQSLNSPFYPVTDHDLFVNGIDLGTIESLAGSAWSPGVVRNGYLRVDATGNTTITSVAFQDNTGVDFLMVDHLAVEGASAPEPTSWLLLGSGVLSILGAARHRLLT